MNDIINEFNDYAKENNIDIYLNEIYLSKKNTTINMLNLSSSLESLLLKGSTKYDLIMISPIYLYRFENSVEDLKKYISKDILDLYSNKNVKSIGTKNNKIMGLPLYNDVGVLYSNNIYLKKYNLTVPETWDELIEKAKFIMDREKEQGNSDLIGFMGNFQNSEILVPSTMEYLYSFRDTIDSPLPNFNSENAHRAFKKLLEIKEKVSSNDSFRLSEDKIVPLLISRKVIFGRFWNVPLSGLYTISRLPGEKKGISASWINGYYLLMNKYITEEKKEAVARVIEFTLSKNIQKMILLKYMKISGSDVLFQDEDLCKQFDCDFYHSLQFLSREAETASEQTDYNSKFINYVYNYIYNGADLDETLQNLEYMAFTYSIEYGSIYGIISIVLTLFLFVLIMGSFSLMLMKKFNYFLGVFDKDFWFVCLLGLSSSLMSNFCLVGDITEFKCNIRMVILYISISLYLYTFFIKLLICFPKRNKYSEFFNNHCHLVLLTLFITDIMCIIPFLVLSPYKVNLVVIEDGMNYNMCSLWNKIYYLYFVFIMGYKFLIILAIGFLTFIEWNMEGIYRSIRNISSILTLNILFLVIICVLFIIDFQNIYYYFILNIGFELLFAFTNYFMLIFLKIYHERTKVDDKDINIINSRKISTNTKVSKHDSDKLNFRERMLSYHYANSSLEIYGSSDDKMNKFSGSNDKMNKISGSNDKMNKINRSNSSSIPKEPQVVLYTSIISSDQKTDISNDNTLMENKINNSLNNI
jgi:ABC-type glycerol-3-phosphate transport system substrate-binding protein